MKQAEFKLVGTKPLLFHAFKPECIIKKTTIKKSGTSGDNPDEWKETVFCDGKKLYLPDTYFFAFVRSGASFIKIGRGTIQKKVIACLTIPDDKYYFSNRELPKDITEIENSDLSTNSRDPVFLHICGVTNPNTKGRNVRYRVGLGIGWEVEAKLIWNDAILSKEQILGSVESASMFSGMADGRNNGFGRCILEYFNIENYED